MVHRFLKGVGKGGQTIFTLKKLKGVVINANSNLKCISV
jgi:hypothetical protein